MKRIEFYKTCMKYLFGIVIFGGIITMISLLSLYVSYPVEQSEYAVGYDTYNMKFTKIYTQGKYPIKVGEKMYIIKRTLQDIDKKLICMTKDKILINLSIEIQYKYNKEDLIEKILKKFSSIGYFNIFLFDRITSSVINSCLEYNAEEYYTDRSIIDKKMYNDLINNINNYYLGVDIEFFQLINIKFPQKISKSITKKQNIEQQSLTAQNDRASLITEANTILLEMKKQADILIINANNNANITLNNAFINSQIQQVLWNNRAYTYLHSNDVLELNSTDLIDYIQSSLISKSNSLLSNFKF
jgi:regulator of protease activity HflC (stomatin/prohibitin superfamily)